MSRVLVTGATGFVARTLVPRLAQEGHEITAAVRRDVPVPGASSVVARQEMGPTTDWSRALDGVDAVVHLAALAHEVHHASALAEYQRVNVDGTRALAEAAAKAGVKRFAYLSTAKVMGEGKLGPMRPWRESDEPRPEGAYGATKLAAEGVVRDVGTAAGMGTVILRPPVVYGPGLKANLLRLVRAIDRGMPLPLGRASNLRSLLFAGNLADAIAVSLSHPAAPGRTFFVADDEAVSTADLARRIGDRLGKRARLVPVPTRALLLAGTALGRTLDVERALATLLVDATTIRKALGWEPRWSLDEGLAATVAWYREANGAATASGPSRRPP